MLGDDLIHLLGGRIPRDSAGQRSAESALAARLATRDRTEPLQVLDLGCGKGDSIDLFRDLAPGVRWSGVDIEGSAEVGMRTREDADFHTFDGERLPFPDEHFDLVWCKQVLEHVENPRPLLADARRVLRPGGLLIGSTSQLEPFHSRSTANPTPYGLSLAFASAGLTTAELRPGIDSLTLIVRRGVGGGRFCDRWWTRESPLNRVLDVYARLRGLEPQSVNAAKLVLCGQFVFVAERPQERGSAGEAKA